MENLSEIIDRLTNVRNAIIKTHRCLNLEIPFPPGSNDLEWALLELDMAVISLKRQIKNEKLEKNP